ncbi:MAG: hypothetical protein WDZ41_01950 [Candidatus Babeliales bacterium]
MNLQEQLEELLFENDFRNIKVVEFESGGLLYNCTFLVPQNKQVTEKSMQRLLNQLDLEVVELIHGTKAAYLQVCVKDGLND